MVFTHQFETSSLPAEEQREKGAIILHVVGLIYMFVALAKMPLNRGAGPINEWTVSLYRILRIY